MKRLIISVLAALTLTLAAFASDGRIREIDIVLTLNPDGSATVCERWDVRVASGTEWYLVRGNLGDIRIPTLSVSENGGQYRYVGVELARYLTDNGLCLEEYLDPGATISPDL